MIDLTLYRIRIGCNSGRNVATKMCRITNKVGLTCGIRFNGDFLTPTRSSNILNAILFFVLAVLSIIILVFSYSIEHLLCSYGRGWVSPIPACGRAIWGLSLISTGHIKIAYLLLIMRLILRYLNIYRFDSSSFKRCYMGKKPSKFKTILQLLLSTALLNFLMIAIVNPSMLNPGPDHLKVCYQNVRGLIPFSNLKQSQPNLDQTKIYELNTYLATIKPDVMLLSETWLRKSIKDSEIISTSNYNVYRSDRSQLTHPSDPNNPSKYRTYGGGVLIAARSDIDATIKRISVRRGAEIVAVEISINEVKYIFCVVYRVGTLGSENHKNIVDSIKPFFTGRKAKKVFILRDFNLNKVT